MRKKVGEGVTGWGRGFGDVNQELKVLLKGYKVGVSNHARLDIRRFGSGIRIHPKVHIVYIRPCLHGICKTIL